MAEEPIDGPTGKQTDSTDRPLGARSMSAYLPTPRTQPLADHRTEDQIPNGDTTSSWTGGQEAGMG